TRQRDQDVSIDASSVFVLGAGEGKERAFPKAGVEPRAVLVLARRLNRTRLEEGARAEDAVVVAPEHISMDPGSALRWGVNRPAPRVSVFGGKIAPLHAELFHDGGGGA